MEEALIPFLGNQHDHVLKCLYTNTYSRGNKQEELEVYEQVQNYTGLHRLHWDHGGVVGQIT